MSTSTRAPWTTLVRRLARLEVRQYAALADWVRRRSDVPPGAEAVPYSQLAAPMLWLFVLGSAVEVVVAHVLLHPWPWVQWPVLALGVWGLLWMLGMLAGYRARPHVLGRDVLLVRGGAGVSVEVPYDAVAQVHARERDLSSSARTAEVREDGDDTWLAVGVSGRTNLQLRLRGPMVVERPGLRDVGTAAVTSVGLYVDEPRQVARRLSQRLDHARPRAVCDQAPRGTLEA